ncbi:MAG TPA: hypothetical protein ACN46V_01330, partial [Prochlorococcus sp.]
HNPLADARYDSTGNEDELNHDICGDSLSYRVFPSDLQQVEPHSDSFSADLWFLAEQVYRRTRSELPLLQMRESFLFLGLVCKGCPKTHHFRIDGDIVS